MKINELRKQVCSWALKELSNRNVYISNWDKTIILNPGGIKHTTSFSNKNYIEKLNCMYYLVEILENATFSHTENDKRNRNEIKKRFFIIHSSKKIARFEIPSV